MGLVGSEVFFGFSFDLTITCRVRNAKQGEAFGDLFIVQEALIRLIKRATRQLACAGGAGASAARIGQISASFLCRIQDVLIVGTGKVGCPFRCGDRDLIRSHWFNQRMHQSIIGLDAFADSFKEDFGIDAASYTESISMSLITDFSGQIACWLGIWIQPLNSENPGCT